MQTYKTLFYTLNTARYNRPIQIYNKDFAIKKYLQMGGMGLFTTLLCGCLNNDSNSSTPTVNVAMGNAFTATATLSGAYQNQTITATTNEPGATITPASCTISSPTYTCNFSVLTNWNTNLANSSSQPYTVTFDSNGSGTLTGTSLNYNVLTPTVYLAQTGTNPTTDTPQTGVPWPNDRFTEDNAPECLKDNLTGLVWIQDPGNNLYEWQEAEDYVQTLNVGSGTCGYTDWRLPTISEFVSITNYAEDETFGPAVWLNANGFTSIDESDMSGYWSATPFVPETPDPDTHHWYMALDTGHVGYDVNPSQGHAWAVRGGSAAAPAQVANVTSGPGPDAVWPSTRFTTDSTGNCEIDNLTGLMWIRDVNTVPIIGLANGSATTWSNAVSSIAEINSGSGLCGYTDWRLPNNSELRSLVNYGVADSTAWLDSQGFANVSKSDPGNYYYWTSTKHATDPSSTSWAVVLVSGVVDSEFQGNSNYVFPVRGGY